MTIKFHTKDPTIILQIVDEVNGDKPYAHISKSYDITRYHIKKIYLHFHDIVTVESIQLKLDEIDKINNTPKIYTRDYKKNYENHKQYYKDYVRKRRLKIKLEKAKNLIEKHNSKD